MGKEKVVDSGVSAMGKKVKQLLDSVVSSMGKM
jgi:hypothetical protein